MIPGRALHRLAANICSEKTLERVVEPAIADLQQEYCGAGNLATRVRILLAGYVAILKVIAMCAVSVSLESADERRAVARTLTWSVTIVVLITALLMVPPLYRHRPPSVRGWEIATTLLPQALGLAIPLGVAFGIAFGLGSRATMSIAKMLLLCALAASVLNFGVLAWGVPAGNQAFREVTFRELRARGYQVAVIDLPKGYSEMKLSELRGEITHHLADGQPRRARRLTFSFHLRFALAAATLALVSVLLAAPVNRRGWRVALAFGACCAYWVLMIAGDFGSRRGYLMPPLGAWLPNVVLIATAMLIASWRGPAQAGHSR